MKKYYINVNDFQGGSWAYGCLHTIKEWKNRALQWCDSDGNEELYNYIKKHKLDSELIDMINNYWEINIVEFNYDSIEKIIDSYNKEDYKWLLEDIIDKMSKGD